MAFKQRRIGRTLVGLVGCLSAVALGTATVPLYSAGAQTSLPPQSTENSPGVVASAQDNSELPEIVVTATRRVEKEQNVPISTSVVSQDEVTQIFSAGGDVRALANTVPSLNIELSNGRTFPRFYIRGYGNTDFNTYASQPVSLVYDDVVQEDAALKGFPIFDVADVEVLRGPQGTLFGRNAPAGVVHVQSAKPVLGTWAEQFSVSDGTYNTADFEGVFNAPIGDTMAFRVSAQEQHRDSWVNDPINNTNLEGYDDFAGRAQLLYQPSDDFNALFNLHGRYLSGSARLFRANIIEPGTDDLVPGFDPSKIYTDGKNTQMFSSIGGSAKVNWNVEDITLVSITGFEKILNYFTQGDIDGGYGASYEPTMGPTVTAPNGTVIGIPFAVETGGGVNQHLQLTQEFRAQSNYTGPLNYLVGLYYFFEDTHAPNNDYDQFGNVITDSNETRQINNAAAAFASLDYKPIDDLLLRGGLRYTYDHKEFSILQAFNQSFVNTRDTATGHNLSGDVSATYTVAPDINLYARVATGFRAPSFGAPSSTVGIQVAQSETDTSGEVGVKSFLFDRRVKLDFDLFYYDVHHQQLTAVGGTDNSTRLLNANKTLGEGGELSLSARVTSEVQVAVAASYNFTRIEDPNLSVGVCASCTVLNQLTPLGNALINGNPLPQAPKWTIDPSVTYTHPFGTDQEAFFNADLAYRSSINFFLYRSKEFVGQPFANLGLRAGYRWADEQYEVAAFCRNCLDQIRLVGGIDFDNLTGFINDPVIAGVQFSAKF